MEPFLRLASRVEAWLMRVAVLCFALLVVSQGWLADGDTRRRFLYGDPSDAYAPWIAGDKAIPATAQPGRLEVAVTLVGRRSAPGAVIMVNGRRSTAFEREVAVVEVKPGDRLWIDARGYHESLVFRVVRVTPGLASPPPGLVAHTEGGLADLGRVILSQ